MKKSNRKRKKKECKRLKRIRTLKAMIANQNFGVLYRIMLHFELEELEGKEPPKGTYNWFEKRIPIDHPQTPR